MARPTREELRKLIQEDPEKVIDLILWLFDKVEELTKRVFELEAKLKINSRNSNNPPSTDRFIKPKPKSLREKSGKKTGGQPGHKGYILESNQEPDHIVIIPLNNCPHCGQNFCNQKAEHFKSKKVIELIIKTEITEYRAQTFDCDCGKKVTAKFPEYVSKRVQYGASMLSFLTYLNQYHLIPLNRLTEIIKDTTGHSLSQGTINNAIIKCYKNLEPFETKLKSLLTGSNVVGFDQTGIRCQNQNYWIHVACTLQLTLLFFHKKKGKDAMDEFGILTVFKGIAVHDFDKTFFNYLCYHALCCAHLLRELIYLFEEEEKKWAGSMIDLLREMLQKIKIANEKKLKKLSRLVINRLTNQYHAIIQSALKKCPLQKERTNKRGRIKQTKERNLLTRLLEKKDEILRFINDFRVPFDNNCSERAFRIVKTKQKISGCFRNPENGKMYCRINSYISTAKKNGQSVLNCLLNAFQKQPFIPMDS